MLRPALGDGVRGGIDKTRQSLKGAKAKGLQTRLWLHTHVADAESCLVIFVACRNENYGACESIYMRRWERVGRGEGRVGVEYGQSSRRQRRTESSTSKYPYMPEKVESWHLQ